MSEAEKMRFLTDKTAELIMHATESDLVGFADAFETVGEAYGDHGVFAVCCGLAEAISVLGDMKPAGPFGFIGFKVLDMASGAPLNPDAVDPDSRDVVTAMRFVTAHVNGDGDRNAQDYFHGDRDAMVKLPIGLMKLVGAHGRHKIEQRRAAGEIA